MFPRVICLSQLPHRSSGRQSVLFLRSRKLELPHPAMEGCACRPGAESLRKPRRRFPPFKYELRPLLCASPLSLVFHRQIQYYSGAMKQLSARREFVGLYYAAILASSAYGAHSEGFKYVNPLIGSANGGQLVLLPVFYEFYVLIDTQVMFLPVPLCPTVFLPVVVLLPAIDSF